MPEPHDECTGCQVPLRGHYYETADGDFCCRSCALGEPCYCRRPVDVQPGRGDYVPFSGTGLRRPS